VNVTIAAVDKLRDASLRDGCARYLKKLERHLPVDIAEVKAGTRASEARLLLARIPPDSVVWALDREGSQLSSPELARRLASLQNAGTRRLTLLIGGADGLDDACVRRADFRWSLSRLTFLHEMTRLIVLEQLFRASKINRGEPYHR
jgi:23S rRNA (pseudouridine1915-N3)-methyltransferase